MSRKLYTPTEAKKTLPYVKRIVRDIIEAGRHARQKSLLANASPDDKEELNKLKERLAKLCLELEDIGCSYKDWNFEYGLVDFPSVIEGEPVLLCWRSDEDDILYYHGQHDGFAGRRMIPENFR